MKRFAALLATGAALSALAVTGATQASAQTTGGPSGPGTKNCVDGFPGIVNLRLCASVTGDQVVFSGYATPASIAWTPQKVAFNLTAGVVGGALIGSDSPYVLIPGGGIPVGNVSGTAPCGSSVQATFNVTQWGWPPSTATVTVPVTC
ncbi:hypothetical protein ACIPYS_06335 [Kitasatospora sp. NPDC089913]|uniref:hypothetical protein n=1 Tax=Streptomycetaceae TaxID=2062 RepID=UPI00087A49F7|nr:hypothetical protein [Streptomyces sp. TLI_053]SDT81466.1 hypothetical protein SAMN05216371_6658 [Streptomyces sp. TLI_053]